MSGKRTADAAVFALFGLAALLVLLGGMRFDFAVERELFWTRWIGYLGLAALGLALSVSPLRRMLPEGLRPPTSVRRSLGITAFALVSLHLVVVFWTRLIPDLSMIVTEAHPRAGAAAWVLLAALFLTSFPRLVRMLRLKLWKTLHRLVYVALALSVFHVVLSTRADVRVVAAVVLIGAGLLLVRIHFRKRVLKLPPVSG